ncbi:T9SS type A sorting domain-containing protein [Bacteroides heparinolyticus]|uniref:T9SS type A sorting domain-containing protein n=1 Tax=Prevotella heparinolytica TaxID=28113 RepID=UPI0035A0F7B5
MTDLFKLDSKLNQIQYYILLVAGCTFTQEDLSQAMGMSVTVQPNPATTWATVDYTLPTKLSKATISVTNALGITVMTDELNGNQGQKVIDLRPLANGVYVYTVRCGECVRTGKLVITK